jgi:hypothetical protein
LFVKFLLPFRDLFRTVVFVGALLATVTGISKAQNTCALNSPKGKIKHVIYVQFDNTHFVRDNANVPSDLEQMPSLLSFLEGQGTVLTNHHTPLISHTATDILTSLTGVYGDRHGVPVSNSFRYFNPDGSSNLGVSFAYWTDPLFDPTTSAPTDTKFNMLTADGHNAPAPWVAFTRASLAYVAAMQEHGVPITYAYISDAHDSHSGGGAFGPGSAGYVAALKAYDDAFNKFFTRLAADGITHDNTLFIFTADEGDHFAGGPPSPANCDGVTTPCTYAKIGEINTNLAGLLATEQGNTTPFKVHSDDAPTIYITGNPVRTDPVARNFARALDGLTAVSPITGNTDKISQFLADAVEMKILHMVTADPARTPTLVMFADPNYFLFAGAPNCNSPCVTENPGFAWNHGDVQPEIVTTWLGMVGPGIGDIGVDDGIWSDHTDIRPTILLLTGLKDDYAHDGRVLSEALNGSVLPSSMRGNGNIFAKLARSYKQINACVGQFGLGTLRMSNSALISNDPGDATYNQLENNLANLNAQRDSLASQMIQILEDAAFNGKAIDRGQASSLIQQANQLLQQVPQ